MKWIAGHRAFTILELLISMGASMVIVGALIAGAIGLQKSLGASETYGSSQGDQRRLVDYVSRDLRRSIGIAATDADGAPKKVADETITISDRASLVLTLPGYYKSNVPSNAEFDRPLPVVKYDEGVNYGTAAGPAPEVVVSYRKVFLAEEGSACFVRQEADAQHIIVRRAENLYLRLTIARDGMSGVLEAWFRSPFIGIRPVVSTYDAIMLRNRRSDGFE